MREGCLGTLLLRLSELVCVSKMGGPAGLGLAVQAAVSIGANPWNGPDDCAMRP